MSRLAGGFVHALRAFPKLTGCEHTHIHAIPITQQVRIIGDQDGTGRLGEGGKLAIIRVGDKGEAFGMGSGS